MFDVRNSFGFLAAVFVLLLGAAAAPSAPGGTAELAAQCPETYTGKEFLVSDLEKGCYWGTGRLMRQTQLCVANPHYGVRCVWMCTYYDTESGNWHTTVVNGIRLH